MNHLPLRPNRFARCCRLSSLSGALLALACMTTGCTARVETGAQAGIEDDEIPVETAPPAVYTAPHTDYHGHVVYLVNGRWYYPRGQRWYSYRTEPQPLVRHRTMIQSAPPAHPTYEPRPGEAVRVQ